jgi:hypothetical protein
MALFHTLWPQKDTINIISYIFFCGNLNYLYSILWQFKQLMGRDLVKDIKSETSGEFENTLSSLLMKPDDYDASELRHALTVGVGMGGGAGW